MRPSVGHSVCEYDADMDVLLQRWGRWQRAGTSGLSSVGHGGSDGLGEKEYRDLVAEMLDQLIAQLPRPQKFAVMGIWNHRKSETAIADEWHMPRTKFKAVLCRATGWLCGSLASRIDAEPTLENVMRWERRQ